MAIASEKSDRNHLNSVAIGIWNMPKLARMEKPIIRMMQPEIRTGVISGDLVMGHLGRQVGKLRFTYGKVNARSVSVTIAIRLAFGKRVALRWALVTRWRRECGNGGADQ